MARAETVGLLSLDDAAKVMGINPAHFNGCAHTQVTPLISNACNDLWPQHAWQAGDRVSREEWAQEINTAEDDIASYLNYFPAPTWVAQEVHQFPRHYRPELIRVGGLDSRGYRAGINADYGYIIAAGQRAVSSVSTGVAVVLSDADGDGYNETATVSAATALTDACEVKVYFAGEGGAQEWEIRPARTKAITGGTFTATFWAWQLVDPDLWEALPTVDGFAAIDWTDGDNIEDTVDIYREYNDTTATGATFMWEPEISGAGFVCSSCGGAGCAACALTEQNGCLHVRDAVTGIVVPEPATYSSGSWSTSCFSVCRDPDFVSLYYYAGLTGPRWRRGEKCEPLSRWWQETITWLSVARLERPMCSCQNVTSLHQKLRRDVRVGGGTEFIVTTEVDLTNPFGSRYGEIMAWKRISKLANERADVAVAP